MTSISSSLPAMIASVAAFKGQSSGNGSITTSTPVSSHVSYNSACDVKLSAAAISLMNGSTSQISIVEATQGPVTYGAFAVKASNSSSDAASVSGQNGALDMISQMLASMQNIFQNNRTTDAGSISETANVDQTPTV